MKSRNKIISDAIFKLYQLDISNYDDTFLHTSTTKRMIETNSKSIEEYLKLFETESTEIGLFVEALQVNYSEFFRNTLTFSILESIIIPELVQKHTDKSEIRIWSAACASGQEVYSVSMILNEYLTEKQTEFRIFSTDIALNQVEAAKNGKYNISALGNVSLRRLNRWFEKQDGNYGVKNILKEKIEFSTFDLLNKQYNCPPTSIFGGFDLIFCSNVLFYYKPEIRKKIIDKLGKSLSTQGYLITSETERDILCQQIFHEVYPQSGIFKKVNQLKNQLL